MKKIRRPKLEPSTEAPDVWSYNHCLSELYHDTKPFAIVMRDFRNPLSLRDARLLLDALNHTPTPREITGAEFAELVSSDFALRDHITDLEGLARKLKHVSERLNQTHLAVTLASWARVPPKHGRTPLA